MPAELRTIDGVRLSSLYEAAYGRAQIGGDWYDAFALSPHRLAVSIGDVAGHGIQSAVNINVVRQAIRVSAFIHDDPQHVLADADAILNLDSHPFVSCIYGIIDVRRWTFQYAIAGHTPPVISRGHSDVIPLPFGGVPLGIGIAKFPVHEVTLRPNDTLILHTDGIIEFMHDIDEGERRFHAAIRQLDGHGEPLGPVALLRKTLAGAEPQDDIALLLAHIDPPELSVSFSALPENCRLFRHQLRDYLDCCPLTDSQRFGLTVAAGEAVTNAIEHPLERKGLDVIMEAWMSPANVTVRVRDKGHWAAKQRPTQRGRGIPLMHALVSDVVITPDASGTIVELRESFASPV